MSSNKNRFGVQVLTRGGEKLRSMLRAISSPTNITGYDVGWPAESFYHYNGEANSIHTANVAKINEFGAPSTEPGVNTAKGRNSGIPERRFFTKANDSFHPEMQRLLIAAGRRNKSRRANLKDLEVVGEEHSNAVKASIESFASAGGNAIPTIVKKGVDSPLMETGQMRDDVTHAITRKSDINPERIKNAN